MININEIMIKENIEDMIYEVRGVQVMLSSNVAKLYKTETRIINQTIKRNIMRFSESFCFQLTDEYACTASFKDLGKKCFAITEFNDREYLNKILNVLI